MLSSGAAAAAVGRCSVVEDADIVLDRRSFTLGFEFPAAAAPLFWDCGWEMAKGEKRLRNPFDLSTSAGMEDTDAAGFSCRSEADVSEDEEESRRRWAEAERRRSIGKKEPFEFGALRLSGRGAAGDSPADESSDVLREPDGVLEGLSANTGTSLKCSEGIRI